MKQRKLDGFYFRVQRDGKWGNVCFTDMTETERQEMVEQKPREFLETLCLRLAETLRRIGDELDLDCTS